jgi:hypothetical protein
MENCKPRDILRYLCELRDEKDAQAKQYPNCVTTATEDLMLFIVVSKVKDKFFPELGAEDIGLIVDERSCDGSVVKS